MPDRYGFSPFADSDYLVSPRELDRSFYDAKDCVILLANKGHFGAIASC
jgi:hypothetical protein